MIDRERTEKRVRGLSAAVVHDQRTLLARGFGHADAEAQVASTARTLYRIGSITKLFTATMLMKLRDDGRLHLEEPLEKYVPGLIFNTSFPDARQPTLRQVASHT